MDKNRINPNWVNAPYEVDYLIALPHLRGRWSRKRRLKWKRRFVRRVLPTRQLFDIPLGCVPTLDEGMLVDREGKPVIFFKRLSFTEEEKADYCEAAPCPACDGDVTTPHSANCNYARGN